MIFIRVIKRPITGLLIFISSIYSMSYLPFIGAKRRSNWLGLLGCALAFSATAATPPQAGIASAHPLATQAGHEILAAGGNAFDAAVAISAALAVVEPESSGLGGGGFWLLYKASNQFTTMIDGREKAPLAAHRNMYLDDTQEIIPRLSIDGAKAAGIPGEPAALAHIAKKYGRLPLHKSLAPAIKYAENGFKVNKHFHRLMTFRKKAILESPAARKILLDQDEVPELGYVIKQPELAATLRALAAKGKQGFYAGDIAKQLIKDVVQAGGIWSVKDLQNYQIVEREPIVAQYRDMKIISAAPPSSGGIALVTALNILSAYDLTKTSARNTHLVVEAMRRVYRDRAVYLGDPDFTQIPITELTNPHYAAGLRASIHPDKATASNSLPGIMTSTGGRHTTHFSVIDKYGNRISATLSINYPFGSAFMSPGTGVLLNDEMDDFSAKPLTPNAYGLVGGEANAIAPEKRPLSSMTPTFIETGNQIVALGTPGGSRIISMVLLAVLDFAQGGTPESMVSLSRYHHQYLPDVIQYEENTFGDNELDALTAMGHTFKQIGRQYGNMQVVVWNKQLNQIFAASDPRGEGQALVK